MTYNVRNIAIAIVMAIAAAAVVLVYTTSYRQSVTRGQKRVDVMVASRDIVAGTPAEEASGAMASPPCSRTTRRLAPCRPPRASRARSPARPSTRASRSSPRRSAPRPTQAAQLQITKAERALRVNVRPEGGMIGEVHAGDFVDVFATITTAAEAKNGEIVTPPDPIGSHVETGSTRIFTRRLLTKVRVLEVPDEDKKAPGGLQKSGKDDGATLTLALAQNEATKIAFAETTPDTTKLWFVVRPARGRRAGPADDHRDARVDDRGRRVAGRTPQEVRGAAEAPLSRRFVMSDGSPIKTFITGACAGLAEVRQALQAHPEIEIVGTAVEPGKADQKLASSGAQVILHGTARGDRLPGAEIDAIRQRRPRRSSSSPPAARARCCTRRSAPASPTSCCCRSSPTPSCSRSRRPASSPPAAAAAPASLRASTAEGRVITVFSPKGGVGKTVLATSLATQIARRAGRRVLLLDLDLQFGDAAIMMGVEPEKTIYDLVMTTGELDSEKLAGYVITHPSGSTSCPRRCAPRTPSSWPRTRRTPARRRQGDLRRDRRRHARVLPGPMLATLDRTDRLLLVCDARRPDAEEREAGAADAEPAALPQGAHPPRAQPRHVEGRAGSQGGREGARPEGGLRAARRPRGRRRRQPRRAGADVGAALRCREGDDGDGRDVLRGQARAPCPRRPAGKVAIARRRCAGPA